MRIAQKNQNILAIVPARSGSKGLINKNLKTLAGHPLIAYSIAAGLQTPFIDKTLVSTDCPETLEVARSYGAETPFLRPSEMARDTSRDIQFLQHALSWLEENENYKTDLVFLLRPTSPLRKPQFMLKALEIYQSQADSLTSLRTVIESPASPYKMWRKEGETLSPVVPSSLISVDEPYDAPRQLLQKCFYQAGTIDIISRSCVASGSASGDRIGFLEIDQKDYCDIDSELDLLRAEDCLKNSNDYIRP